MFVPEFLGPFEDSAFSTWLRESDSIFGFYTILFVHGLGMITLAGINSIVALRLLGFAPDIPLAPIKEWFGAAWVGFWVNVVTGILLVCAYPTKAVTNWDFYLKLTLIGLGVWTMQTVKTKVFGDLSLSDAAIMAKGKTLAILTIVIWTGVITAGRFLAYTYVYIIYGHRG